MIDLPPRPLSTPAGPTSSASLPAVRHRPGDLRALIRWWNLEHQRPTTSFVLMEAITRNHIGIRRERLIFPIRQSRPIDDVVQCAAGADHRLPHAIEIHRRNSPSTCFDGLPLVVLSAEVSAANTSAANSATPTMPCPPLRRARYPYPETLQRDAGLRHFVAVTVVTIRSENRHSAKWYSGHKSCRAERRRSNSDRQYGNVYETFVI